MKLYVPAQVGANVYDDLFEPLGDADVQRSLAFPPDDAPPAAPASEADAVHAQIAAQLAPRDGGVVKSSRRVNLYLSACFRGLYFDAPEFDRHRRAYAAAYAARVRVRDRSVNAAFAEVAARLAGAYVVGVHKRVATPATEQMQRRLRIPAAATFADVAARLFVARGGFQRRALVYLATDDAAAPPAFRSVFGDRLVVRDGVRRTDGGVRNGVMNEVHNQPGSGLQEARDALLDALILAHCCDVLVHVDSNVVLSVACMNADLELVHAAEHSDDAADRHDQFTELTSEE